MYYLILVLCFTALTKFGNNGTFQALRIREVISTNEIGVAEVLNLVGSLYEVEGNLKEARESYERSLQILKNKFGSDHADVASLLLSIGDMYDLEYRYEDAFRSYEER